MLEKILLTFSSIVTVVLIWFTIKNVKIKAFVQKVRDAAEDGKIEAAEALELIIDFIGLFKKEE